jgi:hypothetical protein
MRDNIDTHRTLNGYLLHERVSESEGVEEMGDRRYGEHPDDDVQGGNGGQNGVVVGLTSLKKAVQNPRGTDESGLERREDGRRTLG